MFFFGDLNRKLELILAHQTIIMNNLRLFSIKGDKILSALDDLQAAVAKENTVIDSAITLLQGLSAALAAAGTDPVKLAALQTEVTAKSDALAAAVVANTPVAPTL